MISPQAYSPTELWQAVADSDKAYDGVFVYAVRTTGIYCRPSCRSRQPNRENVDFYFLPSEAERDGYRACKRCRPDQMPLHDPQARLIEGVCRHIVAVTDRGNVTLSSLATAFHVSPYHLQRTFKAVLGITPREYADSVRIRAFKGHLHAGESVTDAIYESGYGSNSRLYERVTSQLGIEPARYQKGGGGTTIHYATAPCPLGFVLVAATARGVCAVRLGDDRQVLIQELRDEFRAATLVDGADQIGGALEAVLQHLAGELPRLDLPLDIRATAFQKRVWDELQRIPYGETRTYADVASAMGQPNAARAVGHACARNPAALVVPCHRVVEKDGGLGNYRWGAERKRHTPASSKAHLA